MDNSLVEGGGPFSGVGLGSGGRSPIEVIVFGIIPYMGGESSVLRGPKGGGRGGGISSEKLFEGSVTLGRYGQGTFDWEGVCGARGGSRKSLETVVLNAVAGVTRS